MIIQKIKKSLKCEENTQIFLGIKLLLSLIKKEIKNQEFANQKIKTVIIPFNIKKIGKDAFFGTQIKELKLSKKITYIGEEAFSCNNITNLKIPNNIEYIGEGAFSSNNLKTLILSNNLKILKARVFEQNKLRDISIPTKVTNIENYAFYSNRLDTLDLENNINLKTIGSNAFEYNNLKNLILPPNIETISYEAFKSNNLTSVIIPDSIIYLGERSFCYNKIKELILPNNLLEINYGTFKCNNLKAINIPDKVRKIGNNAFEDNKLIEINLSKDLKKIENYAFSNNLLTELNLPYGIEEIGTCSFEKNRLYNITLPNTINFIGAGAFFHNNLNKVTIPTNISIIKKECFKFNKLESAILPNNLKIIENEAFSYNYLTKLTVPNNVEEIGACAFEKNKLKVLILPKNLKKLNASAFANNELKSIIIPKTLKYISHSTFMNNNLEELLIPEGVEIIQSSAFRFNNLKEVTIPNSIRSIALNAFDENVILKNNLIIEELISIFNQINRKKIINIEEFYNQNETFKKFCSALLKYKLNTSKEEYQIILNKIKKIYYKTRINNMPSFEFIEYMDDKLIENFDFKIYQYIINNNLFDNSEESIEALLDIIEIFGLFEKDKNKYNRLNKLLTIISNNSDYTLTKEQYSRLKESDQRYFKESTRKELRLIKEGTIPQDISFHLKERISPSRYKYLKDLKGTEGTKINKLLNQLYQEEETAYYIPDYNNFDINQINKVIYESDVLEKITKESLHRIFPGTDVTFNEGTYNFLIKYFNIILEDEKLQSLIPTIIEQFQKIKTEYNIPDNDLPTLKQCYCYCLENEFKYTFGNKELAKMASIAGVSSKEAYEYYEKLNSQVKKRKNSILIRNNELYNYNGIILKGRILRCDDPFCMFVGETNYTNCCQKYNCMGESCMKHASTSKDGGIFEVSYLKDNEWIQLCQSWDWQNEGVYCHDNIEATPTLKENQNLKQAVIYVYKEHANKIIKDSSITIDKYIEEQISKIKNHNILQLEKEKIINSLEELRLRQKIKIVTIGSEFNDIAFSKYFTKKIKDIRQPKNYNGYSDSKNNQYIIAGNEKNLIEESNTYEQQPIYKDERYFYKETGEKIQQSTLKLIHDIEQKVYPQEMISYSKNKEPLINNPFLLANIKNEDINNLNVMYGEDWYFIYSINYTNIILHDLAKDNARFNDEKTLQLNEINNALKEVLNISIKEEKTLTAKLREDTTYLIYLMYLKNGLIEQIGDDKEYPYNEEYNYKIITSNLQSNKLKNIKKIRTNPQSKTTIHKVKFKPTKKYIEHYYKSKNKKLIKEHN